MPEIKQKPLTMKQEKFCKEYLMCGNASEAYRRSYNAENSKPETIWKRACELLANRAVKGRIEVLRNEIEEVLGINRITVAQDLLKAKNRVLNQVKLKEKWNPELKQMEFDEDSDGNMIVEFDASGLKGLIAELNKMLGYYATEKKDITSNGETLTSIIID